MQEIDKTHQEFSLSYFGLTPRGLEECTLSNGPMVKRALLETMKMDQNIKFLNNNFSCL